MIYYYRIESDRPYNDFLLTNKEFYNDFYQNHYYKYLKKLNIHNNRESLKNILNHTLEIEFSSKSKSRKVSDLSEVNYINMPVFSDKALNILGELLERNGEFIKTKCIDDDKIYYAYNTLTHFDILDLEKSKKFTEEYNIKTYFYKKNVDFDKLEIFKISSEDISFAGSSSYIGQKFVDLVNKYKLKGDLFLPCSYIKESISHLSEDNILVKKFDRRLYCYNNFPIEPYWKWEKEHFPNDSYID